MARIAEPASSQPIHSAEQSSSQPVEACNPNPTGQRLASTAAEPSCPASQADCALEQSASSIDSDAERKINQKKLDQQSLIESQLKRVYADAQIFCRPFEHQRMLKTAERDIYAITTGKETFADSQSRAHALEQAELRKARAQSELRDNSPKYAQTLKKFCEFICAAQRLCSLETDESKRESMFKDSLRRLEDLMMAIDNIWNGIPGRTPDLPRPAHLQSSRTGDKTSIDLSCQKEEERIEQIRKHLMAKIDTVDGAQAKRVENVANNAVIKEMMVLHDAGNLPEDGSIIFFTREGLLLYQIELNAPKRLERAESAEAAQRHAENTPAFIDISRLKKGLGPDGAGIWRFIGQENRIVGAAVLRTVFKDGKPVELPGSRHGRKGEPMVKKQVEAVIGEVPDEVKVEMPYGNLLNAMRAKKLSRQKSDSDSECQALCEVGESQVIQI